MKWTSITERLPQLDRPVLITVYYEGEVTPTVTESELYEDATSLNNPCWDMGSAKNYTVTAWMYIPKAASFSTGIKYHEMQYVPQEKSYRRNRDIVKVTPTSKN